MSTDLLISADEYWTQYVEINVYKIKFIEPRAGHERVKAVDIRSADCKSRSAGS